MSHQIFKLAKLQLPGWGPLDEKLSNLPINVDLTIGKERSIIMPRDKY